MNEVKIRNKYWVKKQSIVLAFCELVLLVFFLSGCSTIYVKPGDVYQLPASTLAAYKNVVVSPLGYSANDIEFVVSRELSRIGFTLVDKDRFKSLEEKEQLATLFCFIKADREVFGNEATVTLEFYDTNSMIPNNAESLLLKHEDTDMPEWKKLPMKPSGMWQIIIPGIVRQL